MNIINAESSAPKGGQVLLKTFKTAVITVLIPVIDVVMPAKC